MSAIKVGDNFLDLASGEVRVCVQENDGCRLTRWMTARELAKYMLKLRQYVQEDPCCCFIEKGKKVTCDRCEALKFDNSAPA